MSRLPFVSVLMPIRNEAAFVERSLRAVLAQDYPSDRLEVIIADGLSDDSTREIIQAVRNGRVNVTVIDNPGRIVSTGLNAALRLARGEIIVRVDGHCDIANDYVRRCVSHLADDKIDCVGGPLETIGEGYKARAIAASMSSNFGVGGSAFRLIKTGTRLTDTVAFPAYRRETIQRVGPFDEELVRNQDDEYNYRLRKLGGRILLSPDIRSCYYSRADLGKLWKQYFQYGYWKVRVLQKHPRQMRLRQFVPPLFVTALILSLLLLPFSALGQWLLILTIAPYLVLNLGASLVAAGKSGWQYLPLLPLVFAILHLAYGTGFLFGLVRFWNRWGGQQINPQVTKSRNSESVRSAGSRGLPRAFDVTVSLIGLVLSFPLLLLAAAIIAMTSSGGVLFRQERVGCNGKSFILYKLRSMRASNTGPQVTQSDDARITPVGRLLRQTKLDELPTLWNVLKGDMALVGPRPEVPRYVKLEDPLWQTVLSAKPGITDPITLRLRNEQQLLAQVKGNMEKYYLNELLPLKLKGYASYLRERSWRSDLKVLWQTAAAVVFPGPQIARIPPASNTHPEDTKL